MVKARETRRGPQNTLADEPHMTKVRERLSAQGFKSLKEAATKSGMHYDTFVKTIRKGLPSDPKHRIVEALKCLGIYDLVPSSRTG